MTKEASGKTDKVEVEVESPAIATTTEQSEIDSPSKKNTS